MKYYLRRDCRLCHSKNLTLVIKLKDSPFCDDYSKKKKNNQCFYPLDLFQCDSCNNVQLGCVLDIDIRSDRGISSAAKYRLSSNNYDYTSKITNYSKNQSILDIASNKNRLFELISNKMEKYIGIEQERKSDYFYNCNPLEFNTKQAYLLKEKYGTFSLITINNILANIDDIENFIQACSICLNENGQIIIETSYLYDMVDNLVFDFIYHEHLSYFSIEPLIKFFEKFELHPIRIQKIPDKGGSLRIFLDRGSSNYILDKKVQSDFKAEKNNYSGVIFKNFNQRIERQKEIIQHYLRKHKNKKIVGYGASSTSTTLICHYELNKYLDYLVDENSSKIDTYSPGYHIPVYSSEKLRQDPPDVLMILAWRFRDEILRKIEQLPCKVVVPLPEFEEVR